MPGVSSSTHEELETEPVKIKIDGAIAIVTIDRPKSLNSLTNDVLAAIGDTMAALAANPAVRVAVLRGAGQRAFASGADLVSLKTFSPAEAQHHFDLLNGALHAIEQAPFPVIAMIYGFAVGGGCELAAACDLRIAASSARIGVPIGRLGHTLDRINLRRMLRLVSPAVVKAMVLTDTLYDANDAYRLGFFNWVVPDSALEAFAVSIATTVSQKAPLGMRAFKQVMKEVQDGSVNHAGNPDEDVVTSLWLTRDFQEGVSAFFERRTPSFTGK
jgi:enoyl-CoA hydratase